MLSRICQKRIRKSRKIRSTLITTKGAKVKKRTFMLTNSEHRLSLVIILMMNLDKDIDQIQTNLMKKHEDTAEVQEK